MDQREQIPSEKEVHICQTDYVLINCANILQRVLSKKQLDIP